MAEIVVVLALGLVALLAVAFPFLAGRTRYRDRASLEADLDRYRRGLAAGTICGHCKHANEEGSRYCAECGRPLEASRD